MNVRRNIVISAVNLIEGGGFSILEDCLKNLSDSIISTQYNIIALVNEIKRIPKLKGVQYIEFPKAKKRYVFRIYYEYFYFKKLSNRLKPILWFSLHDMSPRVNAEIQAVYMHNPTPFYHPKKLDWKFMPINAVWAYLYKYVYRINIHANNYLVVQQQWLRKEFSKMFSFPENKIIVAKPLAIRNKHNGTYNPSERKNVVFVFPSFPRVFKNFEVVCQAVRILEEEGMSGFELKLTINGSENKYSHYILETYGHLKSIDFVGLQSRADMDALYSISDCLIFPSKLETWGLPISEFMDYNRPMILADLPYAHETAEGASKVMFFNPYDPRSLAKEMKNILLGDESSFESLDVITLRSPHSTTWEELFGILLDERK